MFKFFMYHTESQPAYHRVILPFTHCFQQLREEGIELVYGDEFDDSFDAYHFHYFTDPTVWDEIVRLKQKGKKVVWSIDDNLWEVPKWNPAYEQYEKQRGYLNFLKVAANALWVSTDELRRVVGKGTVLPNLIDLWDWPDLERPANDPLRILWAGSAYHERDLEIVGSVFERLLERYQGIVCLFFGSYPTSTSQWVRLKGSNYGTLAPAERFGNRLGYVMPVESRQFPGVLSNLSPDITVAAVEDCPFSRCKSNLKWLEYSMTGAATVASPMPYKEARGATEHLYELCCELLEDPTQRATLAAADRIDVMANWTWQGWQRESWLNAFRAVAFPTA